MIAFALVDVDGLGGGIGVGLLAPLENERQGVLRRAMRHTYES